jgi:hypothetical protein
MGSWHSGFCVPLSISDLAFRLKTYWRLLKHSKTKWAFIWLSLQRGIILISSHFQITAFSVVVDGCLGLDSWSCAPRQVLNHLSHVPSPFALVIFRIGSLVFPQASWGCRSFCLCFPGNRDDWHVPSHLVYLLRWGVYLTFCPGWPWNAVLPISASWVAGITGMTNWSQSVNHLLNITCVFGGLFFFNRQWYQLWALHFLKSPMVYLNTCRHRHWPQPHTCHHTT